MLSAVGLVTIILSISISIVTVVLFFSNGSIPFQYVELLIIYTIPLSYTVAMFTTMIGTIWSSLTTRRAGVNSPVGLAPIFGVLPLTVVLVISEIIGTSYLTIFTGGVSAALLVVVAVTIFASNKRMVRERFISAA